ncbi:MULTISPECIES: hypothetical protein [unclassified Modestobacter]
MSRSEPVPDPGFVQAQEALAEIERTVADRLSLTPQARELMTTLFPRSTRRRPSGSAGWTMRSRPP